MNTSVLATLGGFLVLGLSPSFVDWQQSPTLQWQIVLFYGIALTLIYVGLFRGPRARV